MSRALFSSPKNKCSANRYNMLALALIPLPIYIYLLVRYSTNVPYQDDFGAILMSLMPGNSGLSHIFDLQNEHRIAWTRFVIKLFLETTGTINFRYLAYIGNSALGALLAVYAITFKLRRLRLSSFIPVTWIMFAPLSWENMTWAMASIQNYFSILFAITAFYLWSRKPISLRVLSVVIAAIATYTSGYGLMVFPVIVFTQLMEFAERKRNHSGWRNRETIIGLVLLTGAILVAVVIVGLYLVNFHTPDTGSRLDIALADPLKCVTFILCYLGSSMPGKTIGLSVAAGTAMVSLFSILMWKRYYRTNPANTGFMIYALMNSLVVALSRTAYGLSYALSSRYTVISMPAMIALYIGIVETWPSIMSKRSVIILLIAAALAFNILWLPIAIDNLSERQNALNDGILMWCKTGQGLRIPNQRIGTRILKQSIRFGIYFPPCTPDIPVKDGRTLFRLAPPGPEAP